MEHFDNTNELSEEWSIAVAGMKILMIYSGCIGVFFTYTGMMGFEISIVTVLLYILAGIFCGYGVRALGVRKYDGVDESGMPKYLKKLALIVTLFLIVVHMVSLYNSVVSLLDYIVAAYNEYYNTGYPILIDVPNIGTDIIPQFRGDYWHTLGKMSHTVVTGSRLGLNTVPLDVSRDTTLFAVSGFIVAMWRTLFGYRRRNIIWCFLSSGIILGIGAFFGVFTTGWQNIFLLFYYINLIILWNQDGEGGIRKKKNRTIISIVTEDAAALLIKSRIAIFTIFLLLVFLVSPRLTKFIKIVNPFDHMNYFIDRFDVHEEEETDGEEVPERHTTTRQPNKVEPDTNNGTLFRAFGNLNTGIREQKEQSLDYLTVTADKRMNQIYLKAYSGERYTGTAWEKLTVEDIRDYLIDLASEDEVFFARSLYEYAALPYNILKDYRGNVSPLFSGVRNNHINVTYLIENQGRQFIPYYADTTASDVIDHYSDIPYYSEGTTNSVNNEVISRGTTYSYDISESEFRGQNAEGYEVTDAGEYTEVAREYEAYYLTIDEYLEVPEQLTRLREVFSQITIDGVTYDLENMESGKSLADEIGIGPCINYVVDYFIQNMDYDLEPEAVPEGSDYIEAFLFDRKTGYCAHYASAATMIFRMMGIPARYCEGFAVTGLTEEDWEPLYHIYDPGEAGADVIIGDDIPYAYSTNINGESAHAWPEIYIKGFGWVPVEVTYSRGGNVMTGGLEIENVVEPTEPLTTPEVTTPQQQTTSKPEQTTKETESQTEQQTTSLSGAEPGVERGHLLSRFAGWLMKYKTVWIVIIAIASIIGIVVLSVNLIHRWKWKKKLRGQVVNRRIQLYGEVFDEQLRFHMSLTEEFRNTENRIHLYEDLFNRASYEKQRKVENGCILTSREYEEMMNLVRYSNRVLEKEDEERIIDTMKWVDRQMNKESTLWKKLKRYFHFLRSMVK